MTTGLEIPHRRSGPELLVLPSLSARLDEGEFVLTQKYLDGIDQYARWWPGRLTSLVHVREESTTDMDHVTVDQSHYNVEVRPVDQHDLAARVHSAALVLLPLSGDELETALICRQKGVPIVFIAEYSLRTEFQIIRSLDKAPHRKLRSMVWTLGNHFKRMRALRLADGLQCSGLPTYLNYRDKLDNVMLFFDNRVRKAELIDEDMLNKRLEMLNGDGPIRLLYGGRFLPMKGVMQLLEVAGHLRDTGLPFHMEIVGDGPLDATLRSAVTSGNLERFVSVHPPLDFQSGWIPKMKLDADLFVCCHPQGDPSSTYTETMSCGLPIVGYANEAFAGLTEYSGIGWSTPMNTVEVAKKIIQLSEDRAQIKKASLDARNFAASIMFEPTFQGRIQHLCEIANLERHS
ncbi:MAG: glycosyltransferase [Pseudomonadota bacterium]